MDALTLPAVLILGPERLVRAPLLVVQSAEAEGPSETGPANAREH